MTEARDLIKQAQELFDRSEDTGRLMIGRSVPAEARREDELVDTHVRGLKEGDRIATVVHGIQLAVVVSGEHKQKWSTIILDDGLEHKTWRVEGDDPVQVYRSVRNAADLAVQRLGINVTELFNQALKSAPGQVTLDLEDSRWLYSRLEEAAEQHATWWRIYGPMLADFVEGNASDDPGRSFLECVAANVHYLERDVLENRFDGRSTSQWSNLVDATTRKVVCDWLRQGFAGWQRVQWSCQEVLGTDDAKSVYQLLQSSRTLEV